MKSMEIFNSIIWDYNGTLLDDLKYSVKSINMMLSKRNMPLMSEKKYREVFSFPIKDYYEKIGFDFSDEDWEKVGLEFMANYASLNPETSVYPGALELLDEFYGEKRQFVLSAMEQNMLEKSVDKAGLKRYFRDIAGINNLYADSKIIKGRALFERQGLDPEKTCFIGDTSHDWEVARQLGCGCILLGCGHQSLSRLKKTECPLVVECHADIKKLLTSSSSGKMNKEG